MPWNVKFNINLQKTSLTTVNFSKNFKPLKVACPFALNYVHNMMFKSTIS